MLSDKLIRYIGSILCVCSFISAQNFTYNNFLSDTLNQSKANSIEIADINNDGIQDLIISGYDSTRFGIFLDTYSGNENGVFERVLESNIISYPDTIAEYFGGIGGIDLSDFNRDGYIDAYLQGSAKSKLYLNNNGNMSDSGYDFLERLDLTYSDAKWGDVNMDGASDLFIMAADESQDVILNRLYVQENGILKRDYNTIFPSLFNGNSSWVDYDNDGDEDLIICGQTADSSASVTRLYQNEPIGRLIEDTNQDLIGLKAGAFRFADLDGDGDKDLIMSGWNNIENSLLTRIYVNEPVGTFTLSENQIDFGVAYGTIDVTDFNLDGLIDFVIAGADSVTNFSSTVVSLKGHIYVNNGNFNFSKIKVIPGARIVRFSDIDNDLNPDLIANGTTDFYDGDSSFTNIYINDISNTNQKPSAPSALTSFVVSTRVVFTWGSGVDANQTPSSLEYNLRIGRNTGENGLLSSATPIHNTNAGHLLVREFNEIPHGNYYWSVQTVDASGIKSDWSNEKELFIPRLATSTQSLPGVYFSAPGWADFNKDGLTDLAITGTSFDGNKVTLLFENDEGLLKQDLNQNILSFFGGHVSWADYNNDGHLDFSLSGFKVENFNTFPGTAFYYWDNNSSTLIYDQQVNVTADIGLGVDLGIIGGSNNFDWGDYDNDGDLDLVIGGQDYTGARLLKIFNNDNGVLVFDDKQINIIPIFPCIVKWVEMNNDGYLDLVAIGGDSTGGTSARVYLNDPSYILENSLGHYKGYLGVTAGAVDFGDFNNDGLIDFVVTGLNFQNQPSTFLVKNFGYSIEAIETDIDGVFYGKPDLADYDNDGDLDLLITGLSSADGTEPISTIYIQSNSGQFSPDLTLSLDSVGYSSSSWADYNNDGDLDLFIAGAKANQDIIAKVYDNLESLTNKNHPPNIVFGLDGTSINGNQITLKWDPSIDPPNPGGGSTPVEGLLYQLQVGTEENEHEIITGHYGIGLTGTTNLTYRYLRNIPEGNYKWRVRSIDHAKSASEWSSWHEFYIDVTAPTIESVQANYVTKEQVILVIKFKEDFFLDTFIEPVVQITHPENPDLNDDSIPDTLTVEKQSFNADSWTGIVLLPDNDSLRYTGKAIQVHISGAQDARQNMMQKVSIYKTPETVISQYGGTSLSTNGKVTILFPQNSISQDINVNILESENAINSSFGDKYLITELYTITTSPQLSLNKPCIIRINFSDSLASDSLFPFIGRIDSNYQNITYLGGSRITLNQKSYIQTHVDSLGMFGVFISDEDSLKNDDYMDYSKLICQPRIFSPGGSVFEFPKTNFLFYMKNEENVIARVFNLSGRLVWTSKPEPTRSGPNIVSWDGKDNNKNVVPSGLYIATIEKNDLVIRSTVGVLNR